MGGLIRYTYEYTPILALRSSGALSGARFYSEILINFKNGLLFDNKLARIFYESAVVSSYKIVMVDPKDARYTEEPPLHPLPFSMMRVIFVCSAGSRKCTSIHLLSQHGQTYLPVSLSTSTLLLWSNPGPWITKHQQ